MRRVIEWSARTRAWRATWRNRTSASARASRRSFDLFLRSFLPIPPGREDEIARKVLIKHLQSGNSYGIKLKERHAKFAQPQLGSWVEDSPTVGTEWTPPRLEGWEPRLH